MVAIAIVAGVDLIGTSERVVTGLYPPEAVTVQGQHIRDLYTIVFLIAVAIFFLVEGLILWTVLRYRRRPEDVTLPAQTHGNAIAEVVWTVVPTLIVAFLFVISWQTLNTVEVVSADPQTRVKAVAGQFQWTFEYLDASGENTVYTQLLPAGEDGGLVLPAGRTVQLSLESPDVIHAFYVPQFLFKRDVVPGRINKFEITINEEDAGQTFRGQCAELCGAGHRLMLFDVHAYTPADYDAWLEQKIAEAEASPPPPPPGPSGAPSGGPPGPSGAPAGSALMVSATFLNFDQRRPAGARRHAVPDRVRQPRPEPPRTTSRSMRAARPDPKSSKARCSRVEPRRPTTCRRSRLAPTPSSARSTPP